MRPPARDRARGPVGEARPGSDAPGRGRTGSTLVILFFVLYAIAVTFPGVVPFNRVFPLVAGLPFVLAWYAGWVVAGGLVLFAYDRSAGKRR